MTFEHKIGVVENADFEATEIGRREVFSPRRLGGLIGLVEQIPSELTPTEAERYVELVDVPRMTSATTSNATAGVHRAVPRA